MDSLARIKCGAGVLLLGALLGTTGCSSGSTGNLLNPFQNEGVEYGEMSLKPILEDSSDGPTGAESARQALEVMGSYQRAQAPQPYNPVMNAAQVRLMWIPDHLNKHGDLVPAHYYYLRVLPQTWAVQDAFDMERQLNVRPESVSDSGTPWVYSESKK